MANTVTLASLIDPEKYGKVYKRGIHLGRWKVRWFVAKEGKLYYFKTNKPNARPLGYFELQHIYIDNGDPSLKRIREKRKNAFKIKVRGHKHEHAGYFLDTDLDRDMRDWLRIFGDRSIESAPGSPTQMRTGDHASAQRRVTTAGPNTLMTPVSVPVLSGGPETTNRQSDEVRNMMTEVKTLMQEFTAAVTGTEATSPTILVNPSSPTQTGMTSEQAEAHIRRKSATMRERMIEKAATLIQATWKAHREHRRYIRLRASAVVLQSAIRRRLELLHRTRLLHAVLLAQRLARGYVYRMRFRRTRQAAVALQAAMRSNVQRKEFLRMRRALTRLQAIVRGVRARRRFMRLASEALYRSKVAWETLENERRYVNSLRTIAEVFQQRLAATSESEQKRLKITPGDMEVLFANISELLRLHTELLRRIEMRMGVSTPANGVVRSMSSLNTPTAGKPAYGPWSKIADVFLEEPYFPETPDLTFAKAYATYVNNHEQARATLERLRSACTECDAFLRQCESDPRCRGLALPALLIMPVQQFPRYELLLGDLKKHMPDDHPDYANVAKAIAAVKQVNEFVNEQKRKAENVAHMAKLQRRLRDKAVGEQLFREAVLEERRSYVREGQLEEVPPEAMAAGLPKKEKFKRRYAFLFDDALMLAKVAAVRHVNTGGRKETASPVLGSPRSSPRRVSTYKFDYVGMLLLDEFDDVIDVNANACTPGEVQEEGEELFLFALSGKRLAMFNARSKEEKQIWFYELRRVLEARRKWREAQRSEDGLATAAEHYPACAPSVVGSSELLIRSASKGQVGPL